MSTRKIKLLSAIISLALVLIARALLHSVPALAILILFPGGMLNLMFRGVHSSWETPWGEATLLLPSAWLWFLISFAALAAYDRYVRRKNYPRSNRPD